MKPTFVYLAFGCILLGSFIFKKPTIEHFLNQGISLPRDDWFTLTLRLSVFFFFMAILNECVWRLFSEQIWIYFKVFGASVLLILFLMINLKLIEKNKKDL